VIRSLRMKLFLGITAVSVAVLGVLSLAIDQTVHRTLVAEFDVVLLEKARSLASMVEQSGHTTHFDFQPLQFPEFEVGAHPSYFEIYLDGASQWHSASLEARHLATDESERNTAKAMPFILPNGRQGRLLAFAFEPLVETNDPTPPPHPLPSCLVLVAQDSAMLNQTLSHLRWLLFSLCGGAILLSGLGLVLVAGRAIRPLGALANRIESVRETDLSTLLPSKGFPTELRPVVDRLNELLTRLGSAFQREKTFTADMAHELRTPLAGLLATLQVARSRRRDVTEYEKAIDKSLKILTQTQSLTENLLLLARAESGQMAARSRPVDLSVLLEEGIAVFHDVAIAGGVTLSFSAVDELKVHADYELLRMVIFNLLDNAARYAAPNSIVEVRQGHIEGTVFVEIANTGHGLTAGDIATLPQRFVRKDVSRSATGVHAGLGLSIAQRLLVLQRGSLKLRLDGEWFVARVDLPGLFAE